MIHNVKRYQNQRGILCVRISCSWKLWENCTDLVCNEDLIKKVWWLNGSWQDSSKDTWTLLLIYWHIYEQSTVLNKLRFVYMVRVAYYENTIALCCPLSVTINITLCEMSVKRYERTNHPFVIGGVIGVIPFHGIQTCMKPQLFFIHDFGFTEMFTWSIIA